MKIKTVGELLKEERLSHNVTLEFLANKTKIKLNYLESLENNRFEELPATPFIKGYIKTYARIFGFEEKPVIAILRRDFKESAKGKLISRDFLKPIVRQKLTWNPVTTSATVIGGIFVTLALFVIYKWYIFSLPPFIQVSAPLDNAEVSSLIKVVGKTKPDASLLLNSQPVALKADGSFVGEITIPREGTTTITLEASDKRGKTRLVQKTVRVKF